MTKAKYAPTIALHDCDSLIYRAGFASQRTTYHFIDGEGVVASGKFASAKKAKEYLEELELVGEDTATLERVTSVDVLSARVGCKKLELFMQEYRKVAGKTITKHEFWLTPKGDKKKSLAGIEKQYQGNRLNAPKPANYEAIREHCLTLSEVKVASEGYEADQVLVNKAQHYGDKAVILSLDKDMCISENTWMIHIDKESGKGEPQWNSSLGWIEDVSKGSYKKGKGGGFLFLLFQAVAGDTADGYNGCKGMGVKKVVPLLENCKSKQEAVDVCLELYKEIYGEYYEYTSWDSQEIKLHYTKLFEQHVRMPFMQYWKKGKQIEFYIEDYYCGHD